MKKSSLLFLLAVFSLPVLAQNSKVKTGVTAYEHGDYDKALSDLNTALQNTKRIKSSYLPKAYYYRGIAQMAVMKQAAKASDMEKVQSIDLLAVAEDYQLAIKNDNGQWANKAKEELKKLKMNFLQLGLTYLNSEIYTEAEKYFQATLDIEEDYMVNDLLAQVKLNQQDFQEAGTLFDKSITLYQKNMPQQPDLLIAYAFYRRALIYSHYSGEFQELDGFYLPTKEDVDKAFETLVNGQQMLEDEWQRTSQQKDTYTAQQWQKLERVYTNTKADLQRFELDLYLKHPDKAQEALAKFEKAIQNEPNNYVLHIAYASLLEKTDKDKAIEIYKKAIKIDDTQEIAFFNLGSTYLNEAAKKHKIAVDELNEAKADTLTKEADELMEKAKPYFDKAIKINPKSISIVRALKQIAIRLELIDDYEKYRNMEKELKGN